MFAGAEIARRNSRCRPGPESLSADRGDIAPCTNHRHTAQRCQQNKSRRASPFSHRAVEVVLRPLFPMESLMPGRKRSQAAWSTSSIRQQNSSQERVVLLQDGVWRHPAKACVNAPPVPFQLIVRIPFQRCQHIRVKLTAPQCWPSGWPLFPTV